jgi:predicted nuclease of predicted toxin-antitoxin system
MRIKLDENLPQSLQPLLDALGHDVDTVVSEGLSGRDDAAVWSAAQESGRFLVTQDLDFSDVRALAPGTHCGLLVVRLAEPGRQALAARIEAAFRGEDVETWRGCFAVLTDRKLRLRRP